ncbi:uncharacterized protein LOC143018656 [Oratosquilla oratoria]|uniref:uncharacterized protein LOC143018656 n=1 Tax=Oratosquilla oratoria TaxID=337810 RepID=UPI003F759B6D
MASYHNNNNLFPRVVHRDTLNLLSEVGEQTASLVATALPHAVRAFAEARADSRRSAVKSVPAEARQGVIRAKPLSLDLFDREATDRVLAAMPTIIQVPVPQYRPRPSTATHQQGHKDIRPGTRSFPQRSKQRGANQPRRGKGGAPGQQRRHRKQPSSTNIKRSTDTATQTAQHTKAEPREK